MNNNILIFFKIIYLIKLSGKGYGYKIQKLGIVPWFTNKLIFVFVKSKINY